MKKLMEETEVLVNALCDEENQPHQWANDPDALKEVLLDWVERSIVKKVQALCDNAPKLPEVKEVTVAMALSLERHMDEIMKTIEQWRESVHAKCVL